MLTVMRRDALCPATSLEGSGRLAGFMRGIASHWHVPAHYSGSRTHRM